jgi:hypothetical protein
MLDAGAEGLADAGQEAEPGRQHRLDLGLDLAGEHRGGALGADGDGHGVAVDDGGGDEVGSEVVDDVDERAGGAADRGGAGVLGRVAVGAVEQCRAGGVAVVDGAFGQRQAALGGPAQHLRVGFGAVDGDAGLGLQEQAQLRDRDPARAGDDDAAAAQVEEDGEMAHASPLAESCPQDRTFSLILSVRGLK